MRKVDMVLTAGMAATTATVCGIDPIENTVEYESGKLRWETDRDYPYPPSVIDVTVETHNGNVTYRYGITEAWSD